MRNLQQKTPLLVDANSEDIPAELIQVDLRKKGEGGYDELWLQNLIACRPLVLPIQEIEAAFSPAFSVCMELPLGSKFLDNLLVTPLGNLIAVECKLWRNPEAQREVIAQAIDYAGRLQRLSYAEFETAIQKARHEPGFRLYAHVLREAGEPEPSFDEKRFIDAVCKNLRTGRLLLLIVGDGVREGAEGMAEFLQQHTGAHFALTLVVLAVYEVPGTSKRLIVPSVPVQTTNIVRGIVHFTDARVTITAPEKQAASDRATTLSEAEFFESLDGLRSGTSTALRAFLAAQDDLHVEYEVRETLIVRMAIGDDKLLPFVISRDGGVDTSYNFNRKEETRSFAERLAAAIPGALAKETPKTWYVARRKSDGSLLTVWDLLEHKEGCRAALEALQKSMKAESQV